MSTALQKQSGSRTTLSEMRDILAHMEGPDLAAATSAIEILNKVKKQGVVGSLEDLALHLARWAPGCQLRHPRMCLYAAHHGAAPLPEGFTATLEGIVKGNGPIHGLCETVDADLRLYEMALEVPSASTAPYLTERQCAESISYGMMAVEPGVDVLCLAAISHGATTIAQTLGEKLITEQMPGFELLRDYGGLDIAAMCGAIVAARFARIPVVLSDFSAVVAAAVLAQEDQKSVEHCLIATHGAGALFDRLNAKMGLKILLEKAYNAHQGMAGILTISLLRGAHRICQHS